MVPYKSLQDLPDAIQNKLPRHAQEIYQAAFNNAWKTYARPEDRDNGSQVEVAHKVAWAAVMKKYHKFHNKWTSRGDK